MLNGSLKSESMTDVWVTFPHGHIALKFLKNSFAALRGIRKHGDVSSPFSPRLFFSSSICKNTNGAFGVAVFGNHDLHINIIFPRSGHFHAPF